MEFILFLDQFLFCVMENNNDNYHYYLKCFDVFKSSFYSIYNAANYRPFI